MPTTGRSADWAWPGAGIAIQAQEPRRKIAKADLRVRIENPLHENDKPIIESAIFEAAKRRSSLDGKKIFENRQPAQRVCFSLRKPQGSREPSLHASLIFRHPPLPATAQEDRRDQYRRREHHGLRSERHGSHRAKPGRIFRQAYLYRASGASEAFGSRSCRCGSKAFDFSATLGAGRRARRSGRRVRRATRRRNQNCYRSSKPNNCR
jgi:hypothetical protein